MVRHLATILYEMFLTDENAPIWDDLSEDDRKIWVQRAQSIIDELNLNPEINPEDVSLLTASRELATWMNDLWSRSEQSTERTINEGARHIRELVNKFK